MHRDFHYFLGRFVLTGNILSKNVLSSKKCGYFSLFVCIAQNGLKNIFRRLIRMENGQVFFIFSYNLRENSV
jgi:hypothetical protein